MRVWFGVFLVVLLSCGALGRGVHAEGLRVALIQDPGGAREADGARQHFAHMESILQRVNLPYSVVTQQDMLEGALDDGYGVAIIPFAPNMSRTGRAILKSFCSDGGKVMCFYTTYGLDSELGLESTAYVPSADRTLFCYAKCRAHPTTGLPEGFKQISWNISSPTPGRGTVVVADWFDVNGKESGHVAATLSQGGFFFSHVLVPEGEQAETNAGIMLRSIAERLSSGPRRRQDIVIVHGTMSESAGGSDARLVGRMVGEMQRILGSVGVGHAVLTDEAVARGALRGRKIAILPLNFRVSDEEAAALQRFTAAGGKVIGCFSVDSRLHSLMGVAGGRFTQGGEATPFNVVKFRPDAPVAFPGSFTQRSPNITAVEPAPDGKVLATWCDTDGTDTRYPAVIMSPTGMYFSYILYAGDVAGTSAFMLAGMAELAGEWVYESSVRHLAGSLWDFRRYQDRDGLAAACRGDARAAEAIAEAARLEDSAREQMASGRLHEAYARLREARKSAELAFIRSLPSRRGREFRGGWIHSVTVPNQDWESFFAGMKERHLNALLPNVCAGGYAHYESDLLPLSRFIQENGPQMEPMLAAAKRHGIEIHLWRVNYNLARPGRDVVAQLAAEGRVCLDTDGNVVAGPNNATLCPSHPENQRLEIEAMLEMTRKFHPDGIHFDYIRYPGGQACYCDGCRERFEAYVGRKVENWPEDVRSDGPLLNEYLQFRRDQITHVVREVSRRSREIDPDVKISAAVFGRWESARDSIGQDWRLWVEKGYLDFVCPMNYTQSVNDLAATVAKQVGWVGGRVPLQSGIGAFRSSSAWHTADLVDTARANGADGLVFFDYRGRVVSDFLPALLEGPFRDTARTPWAR